MSCPMILVVSRSATRMQIYREALEKTGVSCLGISELKEAPAFAAATPLNGILIDTPVLIKATSYEKTMAEDMLLALPSAYLNIAPATDAIKILTATGTRGTFHTFDQFVAACSNFQARIVRPKNRAELNLNALLYHGETDSQTEQTVTMNVSPGGCFVFSASPEYLIDKQVVLDFVCFEDRTPVKATVRWQQSWGRDNAIPGLGLRFDQLTESQAAEIRELLKALDPL